MWKSRILYEKDILRTIWGFLREEQVFKDDDDVEVSHNTVDILKSMFSSKGILSYLQAT